ncbi:PTI1-like tyrosine-protein kinase At3g15890 [Juglans regia]|uniref:PTI1-like tyrosine-protein kinase At3g15890 n=1 Tax=Juglans regia TaxID=51240 RepID=A0A2I4GJP0_JUGRE|nr:PTI1-like tyrosine-protein kinase At3g15890 [Juglans regia]
MENLNDDAALSISSREKRKQNSPSMIFGGLIAISTSGRGWGACNRSAKERGPAGGTPSSRGSSAANENFPNPSRAEIRYVIGKANESCDVYSFGILLLELARGWKPLEKLSATVKRSTTDWALPLVCERKFGELADPKLNGKYVEDALKRLILVALVCANSRPEKRPTMLEVVDLLKGISKEKLAELEKLELFKSLQAADYNDGASVAEDSSDFISEEKDFKPEKKDDRGWK